jgi:3-oxoacyl-[acyl-carrier-protein] synthase-3
MKQGIRPVRICGTGYFLPNEPVGNDRLDDVLGPLDQAPARVQSFVKNIGPRVLAGTGVCFRHFAIDPATRNLTHTYATLATEAARDALQDAGRQPQDVDLLVVAGPSYDYSTPPTSTLVQQHLGIEHCAEMEIHSNCSGVGKAMQVAFDALRSGRYKTALVAYAQLSSVYLRSCYLHQPQMTKTQAALRYILADGAGAVVLEAVDPDAAGQVSHEVLGTYIESVGSKRTPGMTAGGGVADLVAWDKQIPAMYEAGLHHLDQDFNAVNFEAVDFLVAGALRGLKSLDIATTAIDHYVYSIPGKHMYADGLEKVTVPFGVTAERVKFRAENTGYCGGASVLLHFNEMARSGELQPGQKALVYSVESSKWMSGGFVVRW